MVNVATVGRAMDKQNHKCQRPTTCCCSVAGLEPSEECPIHSGGEWPPRCELCGQFMKWRGNETLSNRFGY